MADGSGDLVGFATVYTGCGSDSSTRTNPTTTPAVALVPGAATTLSFDGSPSLPAGSEVFSGAWIVQPEEGAPSGPNALCQTGTAEFPAIALSADGYRDLDLSTRLKAISGVDDQAAGLIFRVTGSDNYYILRANALEGNVNLYTYVNGKRSEIEGASVPVTAGEWHELGVEVRGTTLTGRLYDETVVTADDATFSGAGRIGLWTKADSVTCFDAVTVRLQ